MTPDTVTPAEAYAERQHLQQLRIDLTYTVGDVAALAVFVDDLTDTRQRRLGFLTPNVLALMEAQHVRELRDRRDAQRNGRPTGSGEVPAPGNFAGIAVATEVWGALAHAHQQLGRHLRRRGVCTLHRLPADPSTQDVARAVAWQVLIATDTGLLEALHRDMVAVEETTTRFVDAVESTTPLNAPCPHCERRTLVVRFHDDEIRCDRDPKSRHYEPCTCSDPLCGCKDNPISHRHTWHRARPGGPSPTWYALRDRLNLTRHAQEESPTMTTYTSESEQR